MCLRVSTPPSKNDIEKNENDNEKILSNVKNFPQKIGALPRIELGKLALVTRLGTTPPYYSGKIHFPVSTISTTGPEYLTHQVCYYTEAYVLGALKTIENILKN